jgi:pimeloyl-ACP methyl ester carboxylesterase
MMNASDPWQHYFELPIIAWFQLATHNMARGIVCHNASGVYQIYAWSRATNTLTQRTFNPHGTTLGAISADGEHIYYLEDAQGGQIGHFFRVGFAESDQATDRYDLTPQWVAYTSFYISESPSGAFYGFMTANQHGFQMFVVDTHAQAQPHLRYESDDFSVGPFLSYNAEITVIASTDGENLHFAIESYDTRTGERLHVLRDEYSLQPIGFANRAHDMRFLVVGQDDQWARPFVWNARTGERTNLSFGDALGDITPLDWSSDGETLLLTRTHLGRPFLHTYALKTRTLQPALAWAKAWHISHAHFLEDGRVVALVQNMVTPPRILLDGTPVLTLADTPDHDLQYIKHFRTDGVVTSAWGLGKNPQVLYLHSDPHDALTNQFMPLMSAWYTHGVDILGINYRGSGSFGATQRDSIHGNIGVYEIGDIAEYARQTTGAKTLFGMGYGGFLALNALAQHPTLFDKAIVIDPIVDWRAFYDHAESEEQALIVALMGGTPDEVAQRYEQASPVYHAEKITRPIYLLQGRKHPRYPAETVQRYVDALRALGKSVELTWYEDALSPKEMMTWVLGRK